MDEQNPIPPKNIEKKENFFFELIKFALITAVIVLPIRFYVAQPFVVSGASMEPTFKNGEYLIVDEISYRFNPPQRYDVVIFKLPTEQSKFLIKRIIGLPGETLEFSGKDILIKNKSNPNGFSVNESYVSEITYEMQKTVILGEEEYFVMGDNRSVSYDSRSWGGLDRQFIIGRPLIRLFPIQKIDIMPGELSEITN